MPRRILVVDDETIVLDSIRKALTRDPYDIDTVQSADEALRLLSLSAYDLVITDLMMPGMDGLELLERLRAMGADAQTIMITGYPTIQTGLRAKRLGAFEYVTKPFTRQELRSVVVRAVRRKTDRQASSPSATALSGARGMYQIPEHAWATVEPDGTVRIGMTREFAAGVGEVVGVQLPGAQDLLEQGRVCVLVRAADGIEHSVHAPLSGHVVAINHAVAEDPGLACREPEDTGWLVRIVPHKLNQELGNLMPL
jgi:CheY-like chemotaxis protein/glycine cleavage system H lipoate-binding protein